MLVCVAVFSFTDKARKINKEKTNRERGGVSPSLRADDN